MNGLYLGVLVASLAGSLHCVGMCGGLAAIAGGTQTGPWAPLAYHAARGATYVGLGALAAGLGAAVDVAGLLVGVAHVAAWIAAAILAALAIGALAPSLAARLRTRTAGGPAAARLRRWQTRALQLPPRSRALAIGALSGLLPCGWLWAFVLTAGGTGEPLLGGLVMAAFWLGTVPALTAIVFGARFGLARLAGRLPRAVPVLVLLMSFLFLSERLTVDAGMVAASTEAASVSAFDGQVTAAPAACCASEGSESDGDAKP